MDQDSTLLLELYRAARAMPAAEFPEFAFGLLGGAFRFDGARLLTVEFSGSATLVHGSLCYRDPVDNVLDWAAINRKDLVLAAVRAQCNRPVAFHAGTLYAAPEYAIMRDYATRYEHENGLCMTLHDADSGHTEGLTMYRARDADHFGAREQQLMRALMPHLLEALKQNRLLAAAGAQAKTQAGVQGALLIARLDGTVQYCAGAADALLAQEWHDWQGARLPAALLHALGRPGAGAYCGAHVTVSAERTGQLLFLRVCKQSPLMQLSPREREVAGHYSRGQSTKAIAAQMGLAPATVRNFVQRIYVKLEVSDKAALASLLAGR